MGGGRLGVKKCERWEMGNNVGGGRLGYNCNMWDM